MFRSAQIQGDPINPRCGPNEIPCKSELLIEIGQKIVLIGGIEVFEELRNTISGLRRHIYPLPVEPQGREPVKPIYLQNLSSFAHKLWLLKEDL
jgi:hypothetical protein